MPAYLAKLESLINSGTVLDVLRYVNSEEYIRPSQSYYMEMLMPRRHALGADKPVESGDLNTINELVWNGVVDVRGTTH